MQLCRTLEPDKHLPRSLLHFSGAFSIMELVATDPWGTHAGFNSYALFELVYSIVAAHLVESHVRDLQVSCACIQSTPNITLQSCYVLPHVQRLLPCHA